MFIVDHFLLLGDFNYGMPQNLHLSGLLSLLIPRFHSLQSLFVTVHDAVLYAIEQVEMREHEEGRRRARFETFV